MAREVNCKEWQIIFARSLEEYVYSRGFRNVLEIKYNKEGKLFTVKQNKLYIETEKYDSRGFKFESEKSILEFARLLAAFHNAAEGYVPPAGIKINVKWGRTVEKFKKQLKNIEKFKDLLKDKKELSDFENLISQNIDGIYKRAKECMKVLRTLNYLNSLEDSMKAREVCLNNISEKSVERTKRGLVFSDLFEAGYNMVEDDVAKLVKKAIDKTGKKGTFDDIIKEYSSKRQLDVNSVDFIKAIVSFPYNTSKIITKYLKGEEIDYGKRFSKAKMKDDACNLMEV